MVYKIWWKITGDFTRLQITMRILLLLLVVVAVLAEPKSRLRDVNKVFNVKNTQKTRLETFKPAGFAPILAQDVICLCAEQSV